MTGDCKNLETKNASLERERDFLEEALTQAKDNCTKMIAKCSKLERKNDEMYLDINLKDKQIEEMSEQLKESVQQAQRNDVLARNYMKFAGGSCEESPGSKCARSTRSVCSANFAFADAVLPADARKLGRPFDPMFGKKRSP